MSATKVKVQQFGRFLSNMVMPNIGAFIAWGLIMALFIKDGWFPNEQLAKLVKPMTYYMLPLLIAYTGGKLVAKDRGAVIGVIATMGVIVGSPDVPMFLGAMIAGPLAGYAIKKFDQMVEGRVKSGFEMLVNNFSVGILGLLLAIIAYFAIGPFVVYLTHLLQIGVEFLVAHKLLALTSILIEPAKILFLNNAINHSVFTPLGIDQVTQIGHSIFFLLEANPGPGLGVLIAYSFFGKGAAKQSAPGAAVIHFFGGIHEIYFPYILMNPKLLLAVVLGGMSGIFTLSVFNVGLIAPASPGSIIAVTLMTPKGDYVGVYSAVAVAFAVSFFVSSILLKMSKQGEQSLEEAAEKMNSLKSQSKGAMPQVSTIYVACDAGMGSSATGASMLRNKIKAAGITGIKVVNVAINDLPEDAKLIITHKDLTPRAKEKRPNAKHLSLDNFLDKTFYDEVVELIKEMQDKSHEAEGSEGKETEEGDAAEKSEEKNIFSFSKAQVFLGQSANTKEEAIKLVGSKLLENGFIDADYIPAMLEREKETSTYLGEGIAIPHGTAAAKASIKETGVVFCQFPEGVKFDDDGEKAYILIGIAANNNEHLSVIASITNALDDDKNIEILKNTSDINDILNILK